MVKKIGNDAAYVQGSLCSAIYDFTTGKVFSINPQGTAIISSYINTNLLNEEERRFISEIESATGIAMTVDNIADYNFAEIKPQLNFAWLELTQRCNMRCVHCYEGNEHHESPFPLTCEEWKTVIRHCVKSGCYSIQFIGGEPSICPFLPELIYYAQDVGIQSISIFSNLYDISDGLFKAIKDCKVHVRFSIYGTSAYSHDNVTQRRGSFDRLMACIRRFQEHAIPMYANVVLMKENESEKDTIREFLATHGVKKIHLDEIRKVYGGSQSQHMLDNPVIVYKRPNFLADKETFNKNYYINSCWYGRIAISTDGTVYPCEFERNIIYGNVRNQPLESILTGKELKRHWFLSFREIDKCNCCEYRFACKDCRPMAFAEHGCLYEQNPRCRYNPQTGKWEN